MSIILRVGAVKPNSGQESRYGSGDEASSSYTDGDVLDIPLPEHTYQRPLPSNTQAQNNHGCFGLPYQDHNYGLPPPPSPPRAATPDPPSPLQVNGVVQMEEEVKTTPLVSVVEEIVEDSITRCICGYLHDDGYMICCDKCSVWQHIDCMGVDRNNIPDSYFCELCQPRILDAVQAKVIQKRKREELADSSATDTDPEEAANALASMGKKLPGNRKKSFKQKRSKMKEKALKFRVTKATIQKKARKTGKKEKENIKTAKPKKVFRTASQKMKTLKKSRPLLTEQLSSDVWNSSLSPWVDSYDYAVENQYSHGVRELSCNPQVISESVDISSTLPQDAMGRLAAVADVKKNRKGLKATEKIPAGQVIIEYKGKVKLRQDYDQELALLNSMKKLQPFVLLYSKLNTELCIDARTFGNEARFVRRSCTPNSEVRHIFSQGKLYFVIVSTKDIISGAEITIPFDYNYQNCSFCVECACVRNNCAISRFWKKLKNSQKLAAKELSVKQKKQPSAEGAGGKKSLNDGVKSNSPAKASSSPVKALQMKLTSSSPLKMSSPVKFSNVSTLLAASALLDGQLDIPDTLKLEVSDSTPLSPPPVAAQPVTKSATQTRRSSKVAEITIKEEKPTPSVTLNLSTTVKEKLKAKESKVKESKDHLYHHAEVKKERRPSSRRQSQDEQEEEESSDCHSTPSNLQQQNSVEESTESRKKMTREERKLDAIMKAFEKMEKRQEKKKEAMARGDVHPKKGPSDGKSRKKEGSSAENNPHSISQDEVMEETEEVKVEVTTEHPDKSPERDQESLKEEHFLGSSDDPSSTAAVSAETVSVTPTLCISEETKSIKDDSPQKSNRKSGKRKRRRSRVQSTTVLSDVTCLSSDETFALSNIVPSASVSVPSTPSILTVQSPVPSAEIEDLNSEFKYKTKKHRFSEWSHRHEDESSKQEEMFVQCLPSPNVNAMDHLKRRNSHSSSSLKGTESSVGSAKKRWLRQAMHEVPVSEACNHSLSVSTDSGSASPIHGNASPNPGISMGSPGAGSPVDFVTPLKKRRLMRESLSRETNGTVTSPSAGVLMENISANAVNVTQRTNGVKQIFPAHRHSTDDRMLLHKNYPHRNGFTESVTLPDVDGASTVTSPQSRFLLNSPVVQEQQFHEHTLESLANIPEARSEVFHSPLSNGFSEVPPVASSFISSRKLPLKFRNAFEKMEVDSSEETIHRRTTNGNPIRIEDNGIHAVNSFFSVRTSTKSEDECGIDSSASACLTVNSSAVYNGASSLMEEGSEAGCVTTKSIMNDDSPATVRVDLNAHDMEPSSLSNTPVAAFRERLFSPDVDRLSADLDTQSDCQVNSSEDVVETASLMVHAHVFDSCDICTDSASANVQVEGVSEGGGERENEALTNEMEIEVADSSQQAARAGESNSSGAVDSSQQENKEQVQEFEVEEAGDALTSEVSILHSESNSRLDSEGISSSCQSIEELDEPKVNVCDSAEEAAESAEIRHCEVDSIDAEASHVQEEGLHSIDTETATLRVCDSAGNRTDSITPVNHSEIVDCSVSESFRPEEATFFHSGVESNADSTSSETNKIGLHSSVSIESASRFSCCDSNYDRQRCKDISEGPSAGEESTEGVGVSSSVVDSQAGNSSDWLREEPDTHPLSEYAISTANEQSRFEHHNSTLSNSQETESPADSSETNCFVSMSSSSSSSSRSALISSTASSTSILSSSQCQLPQHPSSTLPSSSPSSTGNLEDVQSPSTSSAVTSPNSGHNPVISPPPVSSTASPTSEATPAAKKKVSLLEYRKRLKEKPVSSGSEVASPSSSSRQTKTFLPSQPVMLSSSSLAFLSSTSKASSSAQTHKKNKMPTLATLPLFKSVDGKKEKKKKQKPEKQLSLSERLRLEFGLEDCGEDINKRKAGEDPGSSTSNDCSQNQVVPPPPPPGASYPFSNHATGNVRGGPGFSVSSSHGHSGFQGSSVSVVNGSQSSTVSYSQQQPSISSSNLKGPPLMSGSRDRSSLAFSPAAGGQSSRHLHTSALPPTAAPFSHHQPSSSSPSSSSSQGTLLGAPPHAQSWTGSTVLSTPPPGTHHGPPPPPPPPPPPLSYDYNHRASHASGSVVPDDRPPPPPPLPPPPLQQTPSSSSLHRHHHHYHSSSSSKSKSNSKAAASSHYSHSSRY